ncbi:MAG: hypothetical protein ACI4NJ_01150 [Cellvibrio sp.]
MTPRQMFENKLTTAPDTNSWKDKKRTLCEFLLSESSNSSTRYFEYVGYETLHAKGKYAGIKLMFIDIRTKEYHCTFFNAKLTRTRDTKHGKAGEPLKDKQFQVGIKHTFYQFWVRNKFDLPKSFSKFHDHMGKLKRGFFKGEVQKDNLLDKRSLIFVCALSDSQPVGIPTQDKLPVDPPAIDVTAAATRYADLEDLPYQSTGLLVDSVELAVSERPTPATAVTGVEAPQNQSVEEWLADYDSAPTSQRSALTTKPSARLFHSMPHPFRSP